jgi:hypothetical protein
MHGGGIQLRGKTGQGGAVARMRSSGSCKVRKGDNMIVCVCVHAAKSQGPDWHGDAVEIGFQVANRRSATRVRVLTPMRSLTRMRVHELAQVLAKKRQGLGSPAPQMCTSVCWGSRWRQAPVGVHDRGQG